MKKIGVLALQGSVIEHIHMLEKLDGITPVFVKTTADLAEIDGLILPGGESTTIGKLMRIFGLLTPLKDRIINGMPVWGTCAGMILLAKEIEGESIHLGVMDISVRRNAYGRQADSFTQSVQIPEFADHEIPLVMIRAPWVGTVREDVRTLCTLNGHIIAVRQGNMLATSFHPELTEDLSVHAYFADMINDINTAGQKY